VNHTRFPKEDHLPYCASGKQSYEGWSCRILWVCVCSLKCPACNARAPYCHLWPVRLYYIFPHYLTNGTIFGGGKKLL